MKAYTKLTVELCCQIVDRKSVGPSSGDLQRRFTVTTGAAVGFRWEGTSRNIQYLVSVSAFWKPPPLTADIICEQTLPSKSGIFWT